MLVSLLPPEIPYCTGRNLKCSNLKTTSKLKRFCKERMTPQEVMRTAAKPCLVRIATWTESRCKFEQRIPCGKSALIHYCSAGENAASQSFLMKQWNSFACLSTVMLFNYRTLSVDVSTTKIGLLTMYQRWNNGLNGNGTEVLKYQELHCNV